jgi:hypothetical protein
MAIGAVARGDLVVVHSAKLGLHGLYVVDAVNGNAVTITDASNSGALAGGHKTTGMPVVDKTTDILAVHTASSIST